MRWAEFTTGDGLRLKLPFRSAAELREFRRRRALAAERVSLLRVRDQLDAAHGLIRELNRELWDARRAARQRETVSGERTA